jgi:capsule polysaccharide modification protein KpsS
MFSPAAKYVRYRRGEKAKRYLERIYTPFDSLRDRKYAIYFLHVEPEITVEGMAFDYQDQESTLRNILASLPADMSLVVKEHAPMVGYRPLEAYAELAHMPGLYFADHNEDSHRLITHAAIVVTLTGTVALEAMLYGIPAIVLGSIYFDSFNGIYKPRHLGELRDLLSKPDVLAGATREDAIRALGSLRRASLPGVPPRVDVSLRETDLDSAKAMMSELKRVCKST